MFCSGIVERFNTLAKNAHKKRENKVTYVWRITGTAHNLLQFSLYRIEFM